MTKLEDLTVMVCFIVNVVGKLNCCELIKSNTFMQGVAAKVLSSFYFISLSHKPTSPCKDTLPKNRNKYSQKRPQSLFPHSCVCERFICPPWSVCLYSAAGKYVDRSWEYLNRSRMWTLGLRLRNSFSENTRFSLQCMYCLNC
jgi:hypothetical protein